MTFRDHLAAGLALALMLMAGPGAARQAAVPSSLSAVDREVGRILGEAQVPGAALVVIEDGRVVLQSQYGVVNRSTREPVTDQTVFRAGSISKSFTAIGVMMLVEDGRLRLDQPLAELVPEAAIANRWAETDPVRLVDVLQHTAGLNDIAYRHYLIEGRDIELAEAVSLYGPYRSRWRSGTRTSYSNAGPVLAGRALEVAAGESFDDFMARRLTGPLGMTSASWRMTPAIAGRVSRSYRAGDLVEERFMDIPGRPSGSLNVTAADLARLPLLMLGRGTLEGATYFSAATADRIETPGDNDTARAGLAYGYALGNVANTQGRVVFHGHDGSIDGFVATYAYAPSIGAAYVLMANSGAEEVLDAARLVRRYLERAQPVPAVIAQPVTAAQREAWSGQYQTVTPRQQLLAPVIGLTQWEGAVFEGDTLRFKGRQWTHVGNGRFQAEGDAGPSIAFVQTGEGVRVQGGEGAHRRISLLEMTAKLAGIVLFGATLVGIVIYAAIWLPSTVMGRLRSRGGLAPRLGPAVAIGMSAAAILTPLILLQTGDLMILGQPSVMGWVAFAVSLAAPLSVLIALVAMIRAGRSSSLPTRLFGFWCAGMAAMVCVYLAVHGWIGLKIWNA